MAITSHHHMKHTQTASGASRMKQLQSAPPGLLRCLIASWSEQRISLLRAAAKVEAWDAFAFSESTQFLRNVFQQKFPLTLVDLPPASNPNYSSLRFAAERTKEVSESLLVISTADGNSSDEVWARQLGAWSYLSELSQQNGWELVFREARQAMARQASTYLESNSQVPQKSNSPATKKSGSQAHQSRST
ncbi:MAG: hypothetical protein MKZ95_00560 [Pirellulales bacterium]|nr:hypothetical protein [Pirellulales bacterium]